MRYFLIVLVCVSVFLPDSRAALGFEGAWSIQAVSVVYQQPGFRDLDTTLGIGPNRSVRVRLETAVDAQPTRARLYLFEVLFADCLVGEGAPVCETPIVDVWGDETPDPVPARGIALRVDTDASYVLTVIAYNPQPASDALFLPGVYR